MNNEENDAHHLNEDKEIDIEHEVKMVGECSRSLSIFNRMRGLSSHRRPLKNQLRDKTVSYVDLL